jgi:hypothetical protein
MVARCVRQPFFLVLFTLSHVASSVESRQSRLDAFGDPLTLPARLG